MTQPPYGGPTGEPSGPPPGGPSGPSGAHGPSFEGSSGPSGPHVPPSGGPSGPSYPSGSYGPPPGGPGGPAGPPPGGPGGPAGPPPGGPYGPPPGGHPGAYGPPPPNGPYGPNPYTTAPKKNNGCLVASIIAAVIAVVLVLGVVSAVFLLSGEEDEGYAATPSCSVAEGASLSLLVPDYQADRQEPIDTGGQDWWDGYECSWITPTTSSGTPAFAYMIVMRNQDRPGTTGQEETVTDLETQTAGYSTTPVEGLGDEALSWYDGAEELGCVGVRMSNIFFSTCYDAATDYAYTESIPEEEAVDGAVSIARDAAEAIRNGGY
ncbi:hypothetical protein SAMN02745673_03740 [Marinactinospora thermotolerans DSM 45154]|uniref:Uncharacterized protein n=1 Tax=Marinactinospora thermotolerans DSM 45154 TaxID=1122192 RepID=A0A1T4SN46_9ACTN|nr:hypothetical protein SAMN02745673_03740 [Marinactinospora thermotolerans DSM 45154]